MHKAHLNQEQIEQDHNVKYIISVDEVGFGSAAFECGLGVAVLPVGSTLQVKDSKAYSSRKLREQAYDRVQAEALWTGVILIPVSELNAKGIMKPKDAAMFKLLIEASEHFSHKESIIILDGSYLPKVIPSELKNYKMVAVPKADTKIKACSAASVLAKVEHDRRVDKWIKSDPDLDKYDFSNNMGYLAPKHLAALREHGVSYVHRTYVKTIRDILNKKDSDE